MSKQPTEKTTSCPDCGAAAKFAPHHCGQGNRCGWHNCPCGTTWTDDGRSVRRPGAAPRKPEKKKD